MRPVDKVAASLISGPGGGVQPSNRSKKGMFDDAAQLAFQIAPEGKRRR
jgi:predicted RNase H-like nuclease